MSVQSGESVTIEFTTRAFATGIGVNADSLPTGKLVQNGVDNAATVTVTNVATGRYKAQVTLPTLAVDDWVELVISATVSSITDSEVIWRDTKDVLLDGSGFVTFNNTTIGVSGDFSATMKTSLGTAVGTAQTGDSFRLIGATGSGLTSLAPSSTALSTTNWTNARAGYLDNLNVGGNVASHADFLAINQSASKHLLLVTVGQYEPGETYTVEMRTFAAADGSAVNADTTPTLTATGNVSGNLSANLSAATNPATGVYRWTYTPGSSPTLEQIRMDGSATISSSVFTLSAYAQTVDEATVVFTATDQTHLTSIYNKLPTGNIADETDVATLLSGVNMTEINGNAAVSTLGKLWVLDGSGNAVGTAANQTTIINEQTALASGITGLGSQLATIAGDIGALGDPMQSGASVELSSAGLDAVMVEAGINARQALSVIGAGEAGKVAGSTLAPIPGTITISAANNPGTNRITAAVDGAGNRTSVTLNLPE